MCACEKFLSSSVLLSTLHLPSSIIFMCFVVLISSHPSSLTPPPYAAFLLSGFYASLADRYGRKFCLLLPTIGYSVYVAMLLLQAVKRSQGGVVSMFMLEACTGKYCIEYVCMYICMYACKYVCVCVCGMGSQY